MSEILHWEQMEEFDVETALRLMARDTMANFVWDHWAKCQQVERLIKKYNDACALLLEKNDRIAEQEQDLKGQLNLMKFQLDKAHDVIERLSNGDESEVLQ